MMAEDLALVEDAQPERRATPRPAPPPPAMAPRIRRFVDWTADRIEAHPLGWVVFIAVCCASTAFIVWNLMVRFDRFDETYALIQERAALERRFDELAEHYSRDELQLLMERISSAESSVFPDYAEIAAWLAAQAVAAQSRGLTLNYEMADPVPAQVRNVANLPITLRLHPEPGSSTAAYDRMLEFLKDLVGTTWHLEFVEARARGDGRQLTELTSTVHVWLDLRSVAEGEGPDSPAPVPTERDSYEPDSGSVFAGEHLP